jgi:phosphoribosylformylglycinamidine (FGAM) synthase-like enzyme
VSMAEMSIWGGIGIQLRPSLNAIELFSAAPGRLIVGVLPQEAKAFEARLKTEMCMPLGTTGGEKVLGMPLSELRLSRVNGAVKI